ncbi:MAG: hypothetical protein RQ875_14230 [Vicingaceae bacterium]|nr:hypothetical protein [Vicingaceae bacterium]
MTNIFKLLSITFLLFISFNGKAQNMYFTPTSQFIKQLKTLKTINLSTFKNLKRINKGDNMDMLKKDYNYFQPSSLNYFTLKSNSSPLNSSSYIKYDNSILNPYHTDPFNSIAYGSFYMIFNKLRK